jgi:hypothetical protein
VLAKEVKAGMMLISVRKRLLSFSIVLRSRIPLELLRDRPLQMLSMLRFQLIESAIRPAFCAGFKHFGSGLFLLEIRTYWRMFLERLKKNIMEDAEVVDMEDMSEESGEVVDKVADGVTTNAVMDQKVKDQKKSAPPGSSSSLSTSTTSRKQRCQVKGKKSDTEQILEVFIKTEKMHAKRQREREKRRDKKD